LDISINWAKTVLQRLAFTLPEGHIKILEIGAAQGRALIGLAHEGHEVYGVEPYGPAIQIANELALHEGVGIDIREGKAEKIPFESNQFDLVLAFAVMEHVDNLNESLNEIYRVLKPGGVFWFSSTSALYPVQFEIKGFPLFGWYLDRLKKRIMRWVVNNKPELVGFTEHPALHWWTPKNARSRLQSTGLNLIGDQWNLRLPSENKGLQRLFIKLATRYKFDPFYGKPCLTGLFLCCSKTTLSPIF
jgi:SAM-dependent methyltransferase